MILESVENGPLLWLTVKENGVTRTKKYSELSATEAIQADCDVKATNIILQGLPPEGGVVIFGRSRDRRDSKHTIALMANLSHYGFDNLTEKDPIISEKKVITKPVDYAALNQLLKDFETRFVPQTELSAEQAFWSRYSMNSNKPNISSSTTIVEVPKELPKVSMVNSSLKKLKFHLASFDVVVKERTTTTAITEGTWGFEHTKACFRDEIIPFVKALKDLFNSFDQFLIDELTEVQNVCNQMEQAVEQHCVEKTKFQDKINDVLIENERILEQAISADIVNIIVHANVNSACKTEKVLVITALKETLSKLKGKVVVNEAVPLHSIDPELLKIDVAPLAPKLRNNKTAHNDYLKHTQEETATLRKIVENERLLNQLNTSLDHACKYTKRIQELLIILKETFPCINDLGTKLMVVTLKNNNKKIRFIENIPSSGKTPIKTTSSINVVSNTHVLSSTEVNMLSSASRSQPQGNTKKDRIQRTQSKAKKNKLEDHHRIVRPSLNKKRMITTTTTVPLRKPIPLDNNTSKHVVTLVYSRKSKAAKKEVPVSNSKINNSLVVQIVLWYLDSRCSKHMTGDHSQLFNFVQKFLGTVKFENDQVAKIMGYGDYKIGNLQPKADIGIFIGYAPTKKAFWIYNRRTRRIVETIHVDFDEQTVMASEQISSRPALNEMTPATIIDQDAPSPSKSQTTPKTQSSIIPRDVEEDNHDIEVAHMENDPNGNDLLLVQIYVDDIIFATSTPELCDLFSNLMCSKFNMSMMGKISFFLGLQISQSPRGIFISQSKYALESLKKYGFESYDPVDTPMVEKSKLDEDKEGKAVDPSYYRGMIGTLLYLTASGHDLQFSLCMCARYEARPTEKHIHAVKRIFRYLHGTVRRGLWYPKDSSVALKAFANADHVGCQDTHHSTYGSVQFLTMDTIIDQQVARDEALVPHAKRLRIEFWATTTVHHHSFWFKMENKKHIVNLESFREMLHIFPRLLHQPFVEPPFEEEILAFLHFLRHSAVIRKHTDVNINKLHQPSKASKAKSLSVLSEVAMTEAQQLTLATKRSLQQTHISQASGSSTDEGTGTLPRVPDVPINESEEEKSWNSTDEEGGDDEGKDGDSDDDGDDGEEGDGDDDDEDDDGEEGNDVDDDQEAEWDDKTDDKEEGGDDEQDSDKEEFIHPSLSTHAEKEPKDEESFDHILKTPEDTDDEGNGEENLGLNVGWEEGHDEEEEEEEEEDELCKDTSYAIAIDLSEMELKKILIENIEGNKFIHRSNKQINLYKALVEAYESNKIVLDTYRDTVTVKRRRDDDADKDEEPFTSASESAIAEEPMQTTFEMQEPAHREFETGADDQPIVESSQHPEWFSQQQKPPTLDHD
uniref:Uncharacterized mitochondrial protein AtMg00810-like n=1 Tax=Tanacetum cinerariifolium TaxID=118510 RepID=A0A6L2KUX7_TANCI|nr:uncharacterized mitochondrial protein AtMg00810-like [Tanacetum cinerariifolium]